MDPAVALDRRAAIHQRRIEEAARAGSGVLEFPRAAAGFPWNKMAFGYALAGNVCAINAGSVRIHGKGVYAVAGASVSLTGATEWIYVNLPWASLAYGAVAHASTEPETTASELRWPLYRFTSDDGGASYELARICHMGDIQIAAPIR